MSGVDWRLSGVSKLSIHGHGSRLGRLHDAVERHKDLVDQTNSRNHNNFRPVPVQGPVIVPEKIHTRYRCQFRALHMQCSSNQGGSNETLDNLEMECGMYFQFSDAPYIAA